MPAQTSWDWSENKRQRKLNTVRDAILWSYAMLSVSRRAMNEMAAGKPYPYAHGRLKAANIEMSRYERGWRNISNLDRDDRLAQEAARVCSHCGIAAEAFQWDHLIPQIRLGGESLPLNQVRSCVRCNTSRGAKDLMDWHRQNLTFPTLGILRRYLKLCLVFVEQHDLSDLELLNIAPASLPFNPSSLPRRFPPVEDLIWDHGYRQ